MPKKSTAAINLHGVAKRAANVRLDPLFGAGQTRFGSAAAVDRYNRLALGLWKSVCGARPCGEAPASAIGGRKHHLG